MRRIQGGFQGGSSHRYDALLVVRDPATPEQPGLAIHDRLEGRRVPELQGVRGLNVVVAVEEHRRLVRPCVAPSPQRE